MNRNSKLNEIDLPEGYILGKNYTVLSRLGSGFESEVYLVQERFTGIERAAKIFYPHRNPSDKAAKFYAKKLHELHNCNLVIKYQLADTIRYKGHQLRFLISEFVSGVALSKFIAGQPGKRLQSFQAVHLLYALAKGIEEIHTLRQYHGDLHSENVIVQRHGLGFELKVLDMYHWGKFSRANVEHDVCCLIQIFHEALGGSKTYAKHPPHIKEICCGLKKTLISKKFRNASQLRAYLENMQWP